MNKFVFYDVMPKKGTESFQLFLGKKHKSKHLLSFWVCRWLDSIHDNVKGSTFIKYKNIAENHIIPQLGNIYIENLTTEMLNDFFKSKKEFGNLNNSKNLSWQTLSDILLVLKNSVSLANEMGIKAKCSFERITIKKTYKNTQALSEYQETKLIATLCSNTDTYKLGILICLFTGMRIGELCALKWENIDLNENTIFISSTMQRLQLENISDKKTKIIITEPKSPASIRLIPFSNTLKKHLVRFASDKTAYVLSGKSDKFVEPRTMQNKFKKYLKESDIETVNFHVLRHTFATRCIEVGVDAKVLSEILGHSSVKITLDRYVHSSMEHKRNNIQKLDTIA